MLILPYPADLPRGPQDSLLPADIAHLNAVGTAVPPHDVHHAFIAWASDRVDDRARPLFARMAARAGIAHRWSVLPGVGGASAVETGGFYADGMPGTAARMAIYAEAAPGLALAAIGALGEQVGLGGITHLVVASCTGFVAPGIDQIIAARLGLSSAVERLLIGFMLLRRSSRCAVRGISSGRTRARGCWW